MWSEQDLKVLIGKCKRMVNFSVNFSVNLFTASLPLNLHLMWTNSHGCYRSPVTFSRQAMFEPVIRDKETTLKPWDNAFINLEFIKHLGM